jgi:hypothetical protein
MDATQVLIHYQDVEGRLDRRGRWSWALEGQSVTRGVLVLISRGLVEIARNGELTRASIRLSESPNQLKWIDPAVLGFRDHRLSGSSDCHPLGPDTKPKLSVAKPYQPFPIVDTPNVQEPYSILHLHPSQTNEPDTSDRVPYLMSGSPSTTVEPPCPL